MSTEKSMNDNDMPDTVAMSDIEKDALGEIGNICMGTCATTLSTLLGKRVVITTPHVTTCKGNEYLQEFEKPVIATEVSYTEGLDGNNVFLLKKEDALLITGLLMGGGMSEEEIGDMYLSAMSEVMNQMVGSSSTALADILHVNINISPPATTEFSHEDQIIESMFADQIFLRINFRMEIEDMLVSNIMQIMPFSFGKKLAVSLLGDDMQDEQPAPVAASASAQAEQPAPAAASPSMQQPQPMPAAASANVQQAQPMPAMASVPNTESGGRNMGNDKREMDLKAVKFQSFGEYNEGTSAAGQQQNIDLIIDVPLQVTVVLGKSRKSIREILAMDMGSVIVLDRLAGEMVDVLVNGKIFARGEVVVIDDNYGVRITEMMQGQIKM